MFDEKYKEEYKNEELYNSLVKKRKSKIDYRKWVFKRIFFGFFALPLLIPIFFLINGNLGGSILMPHDILPNRIYILLVWFCD